MSEEALERYRQRYETWRHLDRLRYTTLQITVGVFSVFAALASTEELVFPLWIWILFAAFLFIQSRVLAKINDGVVGNSSALQEFAKDVGDDKIPNVSDRKSSIFYYFEWIILGFSAISLLIGFVGVFGEK